MATWSAEQTTNVPNLWDILSWHEDQLRRGRKTCPVCGELHRGNCKARRTKYERSNR